MDRTFLALSAVCSLLLFGCRGGESNPGITGGGGAGIGGGSATGGGTSSGGGVGGSGGSPPVFTDANSTLWGVDGELWKADGRLPDYAYAGYHTGTDPLPDVPVTANVKDFGAKGDGTADDTQAFLDAIAATSSGAILVPQGKYVITKRLQIKKSNVVLRGEGPDKSVLVLPKSLGDVYGLTFNSAGQSNWSFSGGFIEVLGSDKGTKLGDVTAAAKLGDATLSVSSAATIKVGDWIHVIGIDKNKTLINRLHADLMVGGDDCIGDKAIDFHSRVKDISGDTITLERPLPVDVDLDWTPIVYAFSPSVSEVGVEHLAMHFAGTTYPGHFKEHGYNGIYLSGVANSWVRDVEIINADYGVNLGNDFFCTVAGVVLDTDFDRGSLVGHHGLNNSHGGDNLFTRFDIKKTFVHDLTVEWYATGVVFASGKGVDLCLDHHRAAPYGPLFTDIDLGKGSRPFASGGSSNRGPHTAAYSTLWNVRALQGFALPSVDFGPRMNFIGDDLKATSLPSDHKEWLLESIPSSKIMPPDIHQAMLAKRLTP